MALPTSYTETTLAAYLHSINPTQSTMLGWSVGNDDAGSYAEIVNDALAGCEVDDIAEIEGRTAIQKLRAIARAVYWRAVMEAHANKMSFGVDGSRYERKALFDQAKVAYGVALAEATGFGYTTPGQQIVAKRIVRGGPYRNSEER